MMNGVRGSFCENHGKALPRSRNTSKKDKFMSKNLKHLNALKHGAFSQMVLFPGEDREELPLFEELEPWAAGAEAITGRSARTAGRAVPHRRALP